MHDERPNLVRRRGCMDHRSPADAGALSRFGTARLMSFALSPFDDLPTAGHPCSGRTGGAVFPFWPRRLFLHGDAQRVESARQIATERSILQHCKDAN